MACRDLGDHRARGPGSRSSSPWDSSVAGRPSRGLTARLQPLCVSTIRRLPAVTLIGFVSIYLFYSNVSVVYAPLTADDGFLAAMLIVIGVAGVIGNLAVGSLTDRYGARWIVTVMLVVTTAAILAAGLTGSNHVLVLATAAVYGAAAWSITGPQHRLLTADSEHAGLPVALNSSAMYSRSPSPGPSGALSRPAGTGRYSSLRVSLLHLLRSCRTALPDGARRSGVVRVTRAPVLLPEFFQIREV